MPETLSSIEQQTDFESDINEILNRKLTPENIDHYADDALDDLVEVVDSALKAFRQQPTVAGGTERADEHAAFTYYGLNPDTIENTLDHVAETADEIRKLDVLLDEITEHSNGVIIPPGDRGIEVTPGDGSFNEKRSIERTKTVLFVLKNNFDVDLRNSKEFKVTSGVLGDTMMRAQSYKMLEISALDRVLFVCDEEDNATFVFDTTRLEKLVMNKKLEAFTKDELHELLEQHKDVGRRLVYSKRFVEEVISLLEEIPEDNEEAIIDEDSSRFLKSKERVPLATIYQLSARGMAKRFDVPQTAITRALNALGDKLGEVEKARFPSIASAYSPEQQELVREWLDEEEGGLSEVQLAEKLGTTPFIIHKIRLELGDEQVITSLRVEGRRFLIPVSQHELIRKMVVEYNEKRGDISAAPEGYESKMDMARRLGVHPRTVAKAINGSQDQLGEVVTALFSNNSSPAYSPDQQRIIEKWLSENMKRQKNSKLGRALLERSA